MSLLNLLCDRTLQHYKHFQMKYKTVLNQSNQMHQQTQNFYPQNAVQQNQFCLSGNNQMQWNQQQLSFTNIQSTISPQQFQQQQQQHSHQIIPQQQQQQQSFNSSNQLLIAPQNVSQMSQHHINQHQQSMQQIQNSNNYNQINPQMPQPLVVKQEYPYGNMPDNTSSLQQNEQNVYMQNEENSIGVSLQMNLHSEHETNIPQNMFHSNQQYHSNQSMHQQQNISQSHIQQSVQHLQQSQQQQIQLNQQKVFQQIQHPTQRDTLFLSQQNNVNSPFDLLAAEKTITFPAKNS